MAVEGFKDVIKIIFDFLGSLVSGLASFFNAIMVIFEISAAPIDWMPTTVFAFMSVCLTVIVLLRVVGR